MDSYLIQTNSRSISVRIVRKKMKTVRLRVNRDGGVVLSAPRGVTERWIRQYLDSKSGWIQTQLQKINTVTPAIPPVIQSGAAVRILGRTYAVEVLPAVQKAVTLTDTRLLIQSPRPGDQEFLARQLEGWWRGQAMALYTDSMHRYFPLIQSRGVKMPLLRIRKMKTLWGSCSIHRGAINLNYYLYKLPPACIDYIVLHELAHFLYRYHDGDFYGFIARYMPDWKERNTLLKGESPC